MSNNNDDLETIKEIMLTVARRCESISEMQDRAERAALNTRQDIQLLTHRMEQMNDRMEQMNDRIDQLAALQAQTELTLQTFIRRMDNEIQRLWEQIQEILNTIRGRFPGNGKGG